jgi:hypothetical protein
MFKRLPQNMILKGGQRQLFFFERSHYAAKWLSTELAHKMREELEVFNYLR